MDHRCRHGLRLRVFRSVRTDSAEPVHVATGYCSGRGSSLSMAVVCVGTRQQGARFGLESNDTVNFNFIAVISNFEGKTQLCNSYATAARGLTFATAAAPTTGISVCTTMLGTFSSTRAADGAFVRKLMFAFQNQVMKKVKVKDPGGFQIK